MVKSRKKIYKLGTIIAIPLESDVMELSISRGYYAYARFYHDDVLGVYEKITQGIVKSIDAIVNTSVVFHYITQDHAVQSGEWSIIGEHGFQKPEDAIPPPRATCYSKERNEWTMGRPKVDYNGQLYNATEEQVKGMDIMTVPSNEFFKFIIVDRLICGNHERYKVTS